MDLILELFPDLTTLGLVVAGCFILLGIIIGVAIAAKNRNNF
jgi:hypothetical protein